MQAGHVGALHVHVCLYVCVGVCLNTLDGTVKASFNVYLER